MGARAGIALAAALAGLGTVAQAKVQGFVGRAAAVAPGTGAVIVVRPGASAQPLAPYSLLFKGDVIRLSGPATVRLAVGARRIILTAANSPYTVSDTGSGVSSDADDAFLEGAFEAWRKPRMAVPIYPKVRDEKDRPTPRPSVYLPVGEQWIPNDATQLAFVWERGAGQLRLGGALYDSDQSAFVVTPVPTGVRTSARLEPGDLGWNLLRVAQLPPAPPWYGARPVSSTAERTVRAVYLLRNGPPQWRLFALSELAVLSSQDAVAEALWTAVIAGQF